MKKNITFSKFQQQNVEHVLQATRTIKRVNPVCGVLIPTPGLCRVNPVLVARSNRPYVLPLPTAVAQTVSIVFVRAQYGCYAAIMQGWRSTNRPNKL